MEVRVRRALFQEHQWKDEVTTSLPFPHEGRGPVEDTEGPAQVRTVMATGKADLHQCMTSFKYSVLGVYRLRGVWLPFID